MSKISVVIAAVGLVSLACGGRGEGAGEWQGSERDSAGIRIVENSGEGMWGEGQGWTVTEELVIGSETDPDYQFGTISGIAVADRGRILVLDGQAQSVKVFSSDGEIEYSFGGPGSGPGELGQGAGAIVVGRGDTVLVADMANQRVNRYELDGTEAGSFRVGFEDGIPMNFSVTGDGRLAHQVRFIQFNEDMPEPDSTEYITVREHNGDVVDTLIGFPRGGTIRGRGQMELFAREPLWSLAEGNRVLLGMNDDYRVTRYDADGNPEMIVEREFERVPVTDGDKNTFKRILRQLMLDQGAPPDIVQQFLDGVQFGSHYPVFGQIREGPENTIWVQRARRPSDVFGEESEEEIEDPMTALSDLSSPEWDVFDGDGRLLGTVVFPERFAPSLFDDWDVYGVWRDELDIQHVMKLRIQAPTT